MRTNGEVETCKCGNPNCFRKERVTALLLAKIKAIKEPPTDGVGTWRNDPAYPLLDTLRATNQNPYYFHVSDREAFEQNLQVIAELPTAYSDRLLTNFGDLQVFWVPVIENQDPNAGSGSPAQ